MIVAITGGAGFIGRRLVLNHLAQGDEVRILSRRMPDRMGQPSSVKGYQGDLLLSLGLAPFVDGAEILYHCAGEIRDETRMRQVHVAGTQRLIEAASGRIGRWVQLSSVGVYGARRTGIVTELTELRPVGMYEVTKTESDTLVEKAAADGAFEISILRPSNVYGAEMSNQSLFGLITMVRRGWFFYIGPVGASANYIHIDNVVEGLIRCGRTPSANGQVFNLSDNCPLEHFIDTIAGALGCPSPQVRLPEFPIQLAARLLGCIRGFPLTKTRVDALTGRASYSCTKIERELGYRHVISMEQGLQELVQSWQRRGAG